MCSESGGPVLPHPYPIWPLHATGTSVGGPRGVVWGEEPACVWSWLGRVSRAYSAVDSV